MYGIAVRESGQACWSSCGESSTFSSLGDLSATLNGVLGVGRKTLVDLSGITFLDLSSARELAVRAQLYAHRLTLHNPSLQVTASVEAFGLANWLLFHSRTDREENPRSSLKPPPEPQIVQCSYCR